MASENKKSKTDKRHFWGRDGKFLKRMGKLKRICFFNSCDRQHLKRELNKILNYVESNNI